VCIQMFFLSFSGCPFLGPEAQRAEREGGERGAVLLRRVQGHHRKRRQALHPGPPSHLPPRPQLPARGQRGAVTGEPAPGLPPPAPPPPGVSTPRAHRGLRRAQVAASNIHKVKGQNCP